MKGRPDTKRVLIDATKALLFETSDFTVKEIAEKAFTNVAAINYHFGDKDSLVLIALTELVEGFKQDLFENFDREFSNNVEGLEMALQFLLEAYGRYKGAIKYILLSEDPQAGTKLVEKFFLDEDFTKAFLKRISETSGVTDSKLLYYRYSITISAFLFPLLIEGKNSSASNGTSLTALQEKENKKAFIETLMLLFR